MKYFILFIGLFILVSCSQSKEELLISDYEQTIGNTKTNLNLKFEKVEFIKDITTKDSLEILRKYFNEKRDKKIKEFEFEINSDEMSNEKFKNIINNDKTNNNEIDNILNDFIYGNVSKKELQISINENKINIIQNRYNIKLYKGDCKGTPLEETYNKIKELENKNLDSILSKEYDVVYTIKNPFLNNVEQTISRKYYFNSDISRILKVTK